MELSGTKPSRSPVLRARSIVGTGRYLVGAGGRVPGAARPDSTVRGRRGCDAAGFLAWCFGYDRYQRGFARGWDWVNADSMIAESETFTAWFEEVVEPEVGAVVVYPSVALARDGRYDRVGHAGLVVERPTYWGADAEAWAAMRVIHCAASIQRRHGHAIGETHAVAWADRASCRGASHPRWRTRFLRYIRQDNPLERTSR
jgi:hypothetical protein